MLVATVMAVLAVAGGTAFAVALSGTNGDDTLRGTNGRDAISGNDGDDVLLGLRGKDAMAGGAGRDAVLGGNEVGPLRGDRSLSGGDGGDFIGGGKGSDTLSGGDGKDYLTAGPFNDTARDTVAAGAGDDAVFARSKPAGMDIISCGDGFDRVLVDRKDVTDDCERKFTSPRKFFNAISPNYFAPLP